MTGEAASPLLERMVAAGGVTAPYHDRTVVRHFGDPAAEYAAATGAAAVFDRSHRTRLTVSGKAASQMLKGVLTGVIPAPPVRGSDGLVAGRGGYHAVLTPKGKMISDLWAYLAGAAEEERYLLDVPVAGREGLVDLFARVLPPRFARVGDVTGSTAAITVVGPEAASLVARVALAGSTDGVVLSGLSEGEWRATSDDASAILVARTEEVWPAAFSVIGPTGEVTALWSRLVEAGARPAGLGVWSTLRVEAARPVFGTDMDSETIPTEAGIDDRAIDHAKGCYTGQEVIVRIRDRGHVNRSLKLLRLGDVATPSAGAELTSPDDGAVVGRVTSAVQSPREGGVVALAYVRRGIEKVLLDGREVAVPE